MKKLILILALFSSGIFTACKARRSEATLKTSPSNSTIDNSSQNEEFCGLLWKHAIENAPDDSQPYIYGIAQGVKKIGVMPEFAAYTLVSVDGDPNRRPNTELVSWDDFLKNWSSISYTFDDFRVENFKAAVNQGFARYLDPNEILTFEAGLKTLPPLVKKGDSYWPLARLYLRDTSIVSAEEGAQVWIKYRVVLPDIYKDYSQRQWYPAFTYSSIARCVKDENRLYVNNAPKINTPQERDILSQIAKDLKVSRPGLID